MDRRGFLGRFLGGVTAAVVGSRTDLLTKLEAAGVDDPEKLLWTPDEKTIFVPPGKTIISAAEVERQFQAICFQETRPDPVRRPNSIEVTLGDGRIEWYDDLNPRSRPTRVLNGPGDPKYDRPMLFDGRSNEQQYLNYMKEYGKVQREIQAQNRKNWGASKTTEEWGKSQAPGFTLYKNNQEVKD